MKSTETMPAPAGARQIGQVLAGRYRLAMSKGGDDVADVWHALDESTQTVVTLEILRDRGNDAARKRFLAEARRMSAIERPSVMRVSSIVDAGTDTFIVFEHLIPLPVVIPELAVAKDVRPETTAPQAPSPFVSMLTAVAGPTRAAAHDDVGSDETAPTIVELDDVREPSVPHLVAATTRLPEAMRDATRSLVSARTDVSRLVPWLTRLLADARGFVRDVMHDAEIDALIADAGAFLSGARARVSRRFNAASVTSLVASARARAKPVSEGGAAGSGIAMPNIAALALSVASSAGPLSARARAHPVISAIAIGTLVLIVFIVSPLDDAISGALRGGRAATSATVAPRATLAPAPFVLPLLNAYGATFESQGPYPTTTPGGPVEFVVALRNTGSAGWYRGIDGAQAALATTDGAGVAVQSTEYVAPGQVGWFVVRFQARAALGTYTVHLLPRIDGRGQLPELGLFTVVTVAKNP